MRKRSCVHIRSYTSDQHKSFNANQWPRDFSRHLRKKKRDFPSFSPSLFFLKVSNRWVHKLQKKSEGRGSQRGVIGDGLTDGRNPPLFFKNDFAMPHYTPPPQKKNPFKKEVQKKKCNCTYPVIMLYAIRLNQSRIPRSGCVIYLFIFSFSESQKENGVCTCQRGGRENRNVISGWTLSGPTCCPTRPSPIDGQLFFLT